jgi:hypothetical protein
MSKVPYYSAEGSLMYTMVCIRSDITHAIGVVSKYMSNPIVEHWNAVKWILNYLRGTSNKFLCFGDSNTDLKGYVDLDLAGDIYTRHNTTCYIFIVGGIIVSWISRLKKVVSLSTTKLEYVDTTKDEKEMIWLQIFMEELGKQKAISYLFREY